MEIVPVDILSANVPPRDLFRRGEFHQSAGLNRPLPQRRNHRINRIPNKGEPVLEMRPPDIRRETSVAQIDFGRGRKKRGIPFAQPPQRVTGFRGQGQDVWPGSRIPSHGIR